MPYVTTEVEVWVDNEDVLQDVPDIDLKYELENRGYKVIETSNEERKEPLFHNELWKLYQIYLSCSSKTFEKELKELFRNSLGVSIY